MTIDIVPRFVIHVLPGKDVDLVSSEWTDHVIRHRESLSQFFPLIVSLENLRFLFVNA